MPFDNPYFPTQFDVGTIGGPHVHMDSNGVDVTDGLGQHVKLEPAFLVHAGPAVVFLPSAAFDDAHGGYIFTQLFDSGHGGTAPGLIFASPTGSHAGLTSLALYADDSGMPYNNAFAQLTNGGSQLKLQHGPGTVAGADSFTVDISNAGTGIADAHLLLSTIFSVTVATNTLTWDGHDLEVGGAGLGFSPVVLTNRGLLGTPNPTGQPALGGWFNGMGVQTNLPWNDFVSVFAIRPGDAAPGQPVFVVTNQGDLIIGRNDGANNSFPIGITAGGVSTSKSGSRGGISDPSGTIIGGPFPTLGTWYAGMGINVTSAASDATNAFSLIDNTGKILHNFNAAGVMQVSTRTSDPGAPITAGMGQLYVVNGALRYKGGSGTVTTIAAA